MITVEELTDIPKYTQFKYWFFRTSFTDFEVCIRSNDQKWDVIGTISDNGDTDCTVKLHTDHAYKSEAEIKGEFYKYQDRPEYAVGWIEDTDTNSELLIKAYEMKLIGCAMIRAERNGIDPDTIIPTAFKCIEWLRNTDMYAAPASSIYHDAEPSGLLKHTLRVANHALQLCRLPEFTSVGIDSAVLVSLVHDWCKIGRYSQYMKNVKNPDTGVWEQVSAYKRNPPAMPLGHGQASAYLASKFFRLTFAEYASIVWHMSAWYCHESEQDDLQKANETYPVVHLLQFADQLSITSYAD